MPLAQPLASVARSTLSRRGLLGAAALGAAAAGAGLVPNRLLAAAQDSPQAGGSAIYLIGQEGAHIFPSFSSFSTVIEPSAPFFNGLSQPGVEREPIPDLAESWTLSDDELVYTFTLRPDVTWHDGAPFTAHDVKFTWEIIAHPDNASGAQLYSFFLNLEGAPEFKAGEADEITGVTVIDDHTLEARLSHPSAPFFTIGTQQPIVPRHLLQDVPVAQMLEHPFARAPIGTGPFIFEAWNPGDSIIGRANEAYHHGRPILDQIILKLPVLSGNTLVTALIAGEVNAADITLEDYDVLVNEPGIRLVQTPGQGNQYIEFNLAKPLFQDLNVRKALSFALNRQAIADLAWQGRAQIYNSVFPYEWWPTNPETTIFDNDRDQALALFAEAGWTPGASGLLEKDGQPFQFHLVALDQPWWLIVQQQWKEIGVDAQLEFVDFPTLSTQHYITKTFDVVALHVPYSLYTDPHYSLPGYFLSANNRNGYNNPRSDELILAAAASNDQEVRKQLYYEWQEVIAQDVPHLWIGNPDQVYAYTANLSTPQRDSQYFEYRELPTWAWTS